MPAPTLGGGWRQTLLALEEDWDSYGAVSIAVTALETLAGFSVVPCSSGGIQLEVHRDGYDIEIEIDAAGRIVRAVVGHEAPESSATQEREGR
jgi:riboflavin synthase alpha subunit